MADEQPNTPSENVGSPDAPASEPSSDQSEAQPSGPPSWWSRMFHRNGRGQEVEAPDADKAKPEAGTSSSLTLTQEELERRIQAETDRREAKRAAEMKTKARRELRDTDPWQFAEEDRRAEQQIETGQQLDQLFASIGTEHDRVSIDPLVEVLPKDERERILKLEGAGRGLDGRKLVVVESLKALEKHWRAEGAKDAETKLRRNPAFRKQVLAEGRASSPEPEVLPSGNGSAADQTVSTLLRTYYNLG